DLQNNTFTPTALSDYKERVTYDPNGNILTYLRNGTTANNNQLSMDDLTYNYYSGTNKLNHVNDAVGSGNYNEDIDDQASNNYVLDASGNVMAIYENGNNEIKDGKLSQIEVDIYGSSRLGIWHANRDVESSNWWEFRVTPMAGTNGGIKSILERGEINYELT